MSFQAYIDNIKAKTGKTPENFRQLAEKKGLLKPGVKAGEIIAWLKQDFELGHGHAMAIYAVLTDNKMPVKDDNAAIDKHFGGAKAGWKKAFNGIIGKLKKLGDDISIAPTDTYLSILRGKKKVAVVYLTADRMDIGIKLKGAEPTDRFQPAGTWNSMVTHRVRIEDVKQIDKEVMAWLQKAYENA